MVMSFPRARVTATLVQQVAIVLALLITPIRAGAQALALDNAPQSTAPAGSAIAMPTSGLFEQAEVSVHARTSLAGRDRGFEIVQASFIAAASTDLAVTMYQIASGNAREAGFGAWWQDSPVMFAVSKSAMAVAFAYGLERVHRTRPKLAFVLGIVATSVEGSLVVRSARLEP